MAQHHTSKTDWLGQLARGYPTVSLQLTKAEALAIQARQLDHYAATYGDEIRSRVAAITHAEMLDDEPHPTWEVHRHIPYGGKIEAILIEMGKKKSALTAFSPL